MNKEQCPDCAISPIKRPVNFLMSTRIIVSVLDHMMKLMEEQTDEKVKLTTAMVAIDDAISRLRLLTDGPWEDWEKHCKEFSDEIKRRNVTVVEVEEE
jgi:hypothetical protein|tara:strand:+ start:173 stop:466 length:294 start_codon:yes stop_codon:yes gene_type:complete